MKSVRKWVDRISLSIFAVSSAFILANLKSYPELAEYNSTQEIVLRLVQLLFSAV